MIHKKKSVIQIKEQGISRPIPSKANPYKCDNCSKDIITTKTLQLDHCHLTGKFRGWLCKECNISLGNLGDSIEGLFKTIMLSIIGGLVLFLLFFISKFKQSISITKQTKSNLKEVEDEYEEHRKKALEREQKVMRRLQDELNKQKKD
mgnify:CR=1 FL=1